MDSAEIARILLVRAVQERAPARVRDAACLDAAVAAGPLDDPRLWLARRARHLIATLPHPYQALLAMTGALSGGAWIALAAGALAGLLTNYLGPSQRIHALYNPVCALALWNLGAILGLALGRALRLRRPAFLAAGASASASQAEGPRVPKRVERSAPGRLLRWAVPSLWSGLHRTASDAREAALVASVAKAFWGYWIGSAAPLLRLQVRRLLDFGAIGLVAGAVLGMFVRGLFLDYHVVWRSTFVTEPRTIAALLEAFFGLPALLLGQELPGEAGSLALLQPEGVPASAWIRLFAGAAVFFALLPRLALAAGRSLRLHSLARSLDLDLGDPYYADVLRIAREQRVDEVIASIETAVAVEGRRFSDAVASHVCERLYDARIVPRLERFREQGGRLCELEAAIAGECRDFEPELDGYFLRAQVDFGLGLSSAVAEAVAASARFESTPVRGLAGELHQASTGAAVAIGRSIGAGLNAAVGSTVSAAVAIVVGSLSGGFGKTLGVAVVATLSGTSGPVGFLIGALVGLAGASSLYFLGRERAAGAIGSIQLPAFSVRILLRPSWLAKLAADGRRKCHAAVEDLLEEKLASLAPQIADQIWMQVKPLLGERRRARS